MAPYRLCIVVAGNPKDATYAVLAKAAEQLYDAASTHVPGLSYVACLRLTLSLSASAKAPFLGGASDRGEVVLDDRDATTTTGYRLKDAALVGYPYTLVVGRAYLESQHVELHTRYRTLALFSAFATSADDRTPSIRMRIGKHAQRPWWPQTQSSPGCVLKL